MDINSFSTGVAVIDTNRDLNVYTQTQGNSSSDTCCSATSAQASCCGKTESSDDKVLEHLSKYNPNDWAGECPRRHKKLSVCPKLILIVPHRLFPDLRHKGLIFMRCAAEYQSRSCTLGSGMVHLSPGLLRGPVTRRFPEMY